MQAKTTLDKFLMKEKRKETQEKDLPEPKRQRIEETPLELPQVFMEEIQEKAHSFPSKKINMCNTVLYYLNLH